MDDTRNSESCTNFCNDDHKIFRSFSFGSQSSQEPFEVHSNIIDTQSDNIEDECGEENTQIEDYSNLGSYGTSQTINCESSQNSEDHINFHNTAADDSTNGPLSLLSIDTNMTVECISMPDYMVSFFTISVKTALYLCYYCASVYQQWFNRLRYIDTFNVNRRQERKTPLIHIPIAASRCCLDKKTE